MEPLPPSNQNSLIEGTFLDSKYFDPAYWFNKGYDFFHNLLDFSWGVSDDAQNLFYLILLILAIFFLFIIAYAVVRILEVRKKEHDHLHRELAEYAHKEAERAKREASGIGTSRNERWVKTLTYLFSESPSDWKLAIIEADAMLDDLMSQLGFHGANLGEKLRSANQETFRNLTLAWEVHTIRNRIAHEGLSFELSHHEAKRLVAIYEKIFSEFGYT